MSEFEPCEARMHDPEDGITFGCLRDASDGHHLEGGTVHQNHGHHWSALRNLGAVRCPSLISADALGLVWRCVENAGHYPASIHMKTGYKPKAWTDEMSINPPPVKPVRDPHRQDRIMDEAEKLTTIWRGLGPMGRRNVNECVSYDLYKALHALAIEVEGRVPLPADEPDEDEAVNGAPGVTGFAPPVEVDHPTGFDAQLIRRDALHHARKAWGGTMSEDVDRHADNIVQIAQAFEKYLTDGTGRTPAPAPVLPAVPTEPTYRQAKMDVIQAAIAWAEMAHFANLGGPNNWRNWSDKPDQDLINAVAVLTGRPQIDNKEKP